MRLGLLVGLWREGDLSVEEVCALRDEGLVEWVELWLPRSIDPLPDRMKDTLQRAAGRLDLPLSLHSEVTTFAAHRAESVRRRVSSTLTDTVRLAQAVGASVLTLHPPTRLPAEADASRPPRGSRAQWSADETGLLKGTTRDPQQTRGLFAEALRDAGSCRRDFGTALALENMRPHAGDLGLNGVGQLAAFIASGHCSAEVRLCLDVRKAWGEGLMPGSVIEAHSGLLANVHAAGIGPGGQPAPVGEGDTDIDWPAVLASLRAADYSGPVVYEGPAQAAAESLRALHGARREVGAMP